MEQEGVLPRQFPALYLLPTHLSTDELCDLEAQIPTLTRDARNAEVIIGNISRRERALFELRRLGLKTKDAPTAGTAAGPSQKRRKTSAVDSASQHGTTGAEPATDDEVQILGSRPSGAGPAIWTGVLPYERGIKVAKLSWFTDSKARDEILPLDDYLLYEGVALSNGGMEPPDPPSRKQPPVATAGLEVAASSQSSSRQHIRGPPRTKFPLTKPHPSKRPSLIRQSTPENDAAQHMPGVPDFLHTTYSCQRPTPINPPNGGFVEELKKIRTTRLLAGDRIGVRAYSSAIASLAAYPHTLTVSEEVDRLPGCGPKIAVLFQEYKHNGGAIKEVQDAESDPKLSVLKQFYEVWGAAETTAKEWYNKGWRNLDDVVELGWDTLTRVQQIGVKFYDEFLIKIPRSEVESIAGIILEHANKIKGGFHMVVVGGYRRGKKESGDVDLILSHPDEAATENFVTDLVVSLEDSRYVTHTLTLSTRNSERGQAPLAWKGDERRAPGTGFDTLDKALVVWQDPGWTPKPGETRNPNPHRRVDIIISPWRTAGCAVLGWTSGTTFQRDLRRYCKRELGLKFDSSGIRRRTDGSWVDLESEDGRPAPDMLTAERRVFAGLNLEWRPPEERSTG